jgi:hypothetical protein
MPLTITAEHGVSWQIALMLQARNLDKPQEKLKGLSRLPQRLKDGVVVVV